MHGLVREECLNRQWVRSWLSFSAVNWEKKKPRGIPVLILSPHKGAYFNFSENTSSTLMISSQLQDRWRLSHRLPPRSAIQTLVRKGSPVSLKKWTAEAREMAQQSRAPAALLGSPGSSSQCPCSSLKSSITPFPGEPVPSSAFH